MPTPTSRWRGRPGRSPRSSCPTSSPRAASTGTERTYFAHADLEQLHGREEHQLHRGPGGAGERAAVLGEAEIVVQLRDPVTRAVSNWRFSTEHGLEDRPLDAGAVGEPRGPARLGPRQRRRSRRSPTSSAAATSTTSQPWFDRFPDHVHVHFLEDHPRRPGLDRRPVRRLGCRRRTSGPSTATSGQRERRQGARVSARVWRRGSASTSPPSDAELSRRLGRPPALADRGRSPTPAPAR